LTIPLLGTGAAFRARSEPMGGAKKSANLARFIAATYSAWSLDCQFHHRMNLPGGEIRDTPSPV
jgi:hypothetical protein